MRINLANTVVFWSIVIVLIVLMVYTYNILTSHTHTSSVSLEIFEKYSFDRGLDSEINNFPSINVQLAQEDGSIFAKFFSKDNNALIALLVAYSIGLSLLFTYREQSRISKEALDEKIKIEKDRMQSKINIYDNIVQGLSKYEYIITPEINLDDLDKKLDRDVNYILFSSRVVLEKILLHICIRHNLLEEILNDMIAILNKKRILDIRSNGYAHTIKAFGNRVAHPNVKQPMHFSTKDALLVLSTLVALLDNLDSNSLLEGINDVQ